MVTPQACRNAVVCPTRTTTRVAYRNSVTDRGWTRNIQRVYMTDIIFIEEKEAYTYTQKGTKVPPHYNKGRMDANIREAYLYNNT